MKTIWKQEIPVVGEFSQDLKKDARILCIQTINDIPYIWYIVDTEEQKKEKRIFRLYGTGHTMQENVNAPDAYIGTFQMQEGVLVFHLFEVIK